jgi:hypothetical protein
MTYPAAARRPSFLSCKRVSSAASPSAVARPYPTIRRGSVGTVRNDSAITAVSIWSRRLLSDMTDTSLEIMPPSLNATSVSGCCRISVSLNNTPIYEIASAPIHPGGSTQGCFVTLLGISIGHDMSRIRVEKSCSFLAVRAS